MKNKKGFSLVELIIVIAIMAILVGVIAPILIKYIEKSKVSTDTETIDIIRKAIELTLNDPDIQKASDQGTLLLISTFTQPNQERRLDNYSSYTPSNCAFVANVTEICGFNPFENSSSLDLFKSTPANNSGVICIRTNSTGTKFWIFILHSDKEGQKRDFCPTYPDLLNQVIVSESVNN